MTDSERLISLLAAEYPCITIQTTEEEEARILVSSAFFTRNKPLCVWSASDGIRDGVVGSSGVVKDTAHPAAACVFLRSQNWEVGDGAMLLDIAPHLTDPRTMRELRDLIEFVAKRRGHLVFIDHQQLPEVIRSSSTSFEISLPLEAEIDRIVKEVLRSRKDSIGFQIDISKRDFDTVIRNLRGLGRRQIRQIVLDAAIDKAKFEFSDLDRMLAAKRKCLSGDGLLEFVETPATIGDIGGMENLKSWLERRREALTDEAASYGLTSPRGIFMLGVQGAGKSLAAKAVAAAWSRPLLRMDPSLLFDRYIGESERRLHVTLAQAEAMAPNVLWIDEIEKGFASAASQSVDGGLSKRMFGTLLTWMQEHKSAVFLIATANDIESLPPELLRKGRFDEIFFVDLPKFEARKAIFRIHLLKRKRDPRNFDLDALATSADGYSGAEIEQAIVSGLFEAYSAKSELTTDILVRTLRNSPPLSVTMAEKIDNLRSWSKGRCVSADEVGK